MVARGRNANGRPTEVIGQTPMFGEIEDRTTDNVWTPAGLFDQLGLVFDIDVASPVGGVPWIPARHHYTIHDDGLVQPWHGRVWMNPPFSRAAPWAKRFIEHGNGVAIVPAAKSAWFDDLWVRADGITFLPSRFTYMKQGQPHPIFMPSLLVAMGAENAEALHRIGKVR